MPPGCIAKCLFVLNETVTGIQKVKTEKVSPLIFLRLPCSLQEWCHRRRIELPNTMSAFIFYTSSQQTDSKQPHKALLTGYLGAKKANQKIRTAASYKSPGGPSPCLLHSSLRRSSLSGSPKVPAAWVNLRTGASWPRSRSASFFGPAQNDWVSEWAQLRGCEREREGGEGGEVWRGGWGELMHARACIPLLSTVMGTMGRSPCWRLWLERATGLPQGMTPQGKQWTVPFTLQWFFTNCWSKAVSGSDGIFTFLAHREKKTFKTNSFRSVKVKSVSCS